MSHLSGSTLLALCSLSFNSQCDSGWTKHFFEILSIISFVVCIGAFRVKMFSFLQNMWCAAYTESQHWYPAQHVRRYILCDSNVLYGGVWRHQPRHLAKPGFHAVDDNCGFCYDSNTGMERKGPRIRDGWMDDL